MRKFYSFLLATVALLCSTAANAQSFTIDDVNYTVISSGEKTVAIAGSNWPIGTLTIPATVTYESVDYTVTEINDFAFQFCVDITGEVTLPATIKSIGGGAFADCSNITAFNVAADNANYVSVDGVIYTKDMSTVVMCPNAKTGTYTIADGVTTIAWSSFDGCSQLDGIIIPPTVTTIGATAFCNCSSLTQLTIPASVTSVSYDAFGTNDDDKLAGLKNLTLLATTPPSWSDAMWCLPEGATVNVPAEAADAYATTGGWSSVNTAAYDGKCGDDAYCSFNEETGALTIFGTGAMYDYTFNETPWHSNKENITSVTIEEGVTSIGVFAFYACTGLTSVDIPESVTSIGNYAFRECRSLTSIVVDEGNTVYDSRGNCNAIIETASNILLYGCANTVIPSSVTSIGDEAFSNRKGLTSVEIPSSVTSIGDYAFNYCPDLTSVNIPSSVTSIGNDAFCCCESLTSIEIPSSVTSIGESAFYCCRGLTSINIPSSVTSIGDEAFKLCDGLTSIVVDEGNTVYDSRGNCNAIIETASNSLLTGCVNTVIPSSVTSIGKDAFYGCNFMRSIEIPSSVISIEELAFAYCNLTSIVIPESVTSISDCAFQSCQYLTSINIPSSVTSIGESAFNFCISLTSIVSHIAAEDLFAPGNDAFYRIDKDACTIYVPAGAKSTYAATDGWKEFTNIVETYDLTVTAAGYATMYLGTAVEIPAGVEAYTANRIEGDFLIMQAVEDVIPANTAVIIKAEEGNYLFAYSDETPEAIEDNLLRGTLTDTYIKPSALSVAYVLSKVDGVVGMYRAKLKADGTFKNNANRAYMILGELNVGGDDDNLDTSTPGSQLSNGYRFDFSGTTAIESVESEQQGETVYYDLSGRRVENPAKGIYIVNGRKVFIK